MPNRCLPFNPLSGYADPQMGHLDTEDLAAIGVILDERILHELRTLKEEIMSDLDDAVTRITNAVSAGVALIQAEIAELGNTGADVTKLNDAAAALETAVAAAAPAPADGMTTETPAPDAPPAE